MVCFDQSKLIVVRTEASCYDGLSAGLFQMTEQGLQLVHFISRGMTETEKRYSQSENVVVAIYWANIRFAMYLSGAPRFKIVTAHKVADHDVQQDNHQITTWN